MQTQTIIFVGPQGCGKGTQVKNLTEYLEKETDQHVVNIETGKAFRLLAEGGTYTAKRVRELLEQGQMVPNFITKAFVVKYLIGHLDESAHMTMDGFPRNISQVEFVDDLMAFYNRPGITVVYLDTPEEVVRERMLGRGREDDTKELIDERLRLYHEQTKPVIDYYKDREDVNFIHIDGTLPIAKVQEQIIAKLK